LKFEKDELLREQKSQHSKYLTFNAQKHWMSWRLWKHEEFTAEKERDLFRTLFLTARKWYISTQSKTELKTFIKKFTERFNSENFLFDTSTELSNMITMNFFQQKQDESLKSQESSKFEEFQKDSKSKSSLFEMILQQWYEFKMMKMRLEMMKLEV